MVDPITAGLAGIALVTKVAENIKAGINAYNSVAELGDQIDALFKGEQECQKARNKKAGQFDPFSTETVAREVLDHKLAQEKLQEIATLVDFRFGHGTWAGILAERQKRIREAREQAKEAARIKRQRIQEIEDTAKTIGAVVLVVGVFLTCLFVYALMIKDS